MINETENTYFDMNQCKPGDIVVSAQGKEFEYVRKRDTYLCPHVLIDLDYGKEGEVSYVTRTDFGHVFSVGPLHGIHNIVGFKKSAISPMNDEELLKSLNIVPLSIPEDSKNKLNTFFVSLLPEGSTPEDYETYSKNNMCLLESKTYSHPFSDFTEAQYIAKHVSNMTGSTVVIKSVSRFEIKIGDCFIKELDLNGQIILSESNKAKTFDFSEALTALSALKDLHLKPKLIGLHTELFFIYPPAGQQ